MNKPEAPVRAWDTPVWLPSPPRCTHRQVQVAVFVGDAASEAGQSPVRHPLGTEETAAASRTCGDTAGTSLRAEVSPTPSLRISGRSPRTQAWATGMAGQGSAGTAAALTRGVGGTLVVNDLACCRLLPCHQHHVLIPAHLVEGCREKVGVGGMGAGLSRAPTHAPSPGVAA